MPPQELTDLIALAQTGDVAARNRVIEANMRLVTKIATPLARHCGRMGDLPDLVQAGVCGRLGTSGLMRAIEKFDAGRGKRFTTYATRWIRDAVQRELETLQGVEVRGGAKHRGDRVKEITSKLATELERAPTEREIKARCVLLGVDAPSDRVLDRLAKGKREADIDCDTLPSEGDLEASLQMRDAIRQALTALDKLGERERRVVALYFGLGEAPPMSAPKLGKALGITHRRVQVILEGALVKLRKHIGDPSDRG